MERLSTQRAAAGTVTFLKPLRLSFQQNTQQRREPAVLHFDHVPVKVRDVEIQHVQPRNQLSPVQTEGTAFHSVPSARMARSVSQEDWGGTPPRKGAGSGVRALPQGSGRHSAHWVEEQGKTARNLLFSLQGDLLLSLAWVQLPASPQWPPCPPDFLPLLPPCSREPKALKMC